MIVVAEYITRPQNRRRDTNKIGFLGAIRRDEL